MHFLPYVRRKSLEHLFCQCKFSQDFWKSVVLWLQSLHMGIDSLNDCDIILGFTFKRPNWTFLNHVIIAGKQIIYHNRLKNSLPSLSQVIAKLKYSESIERSIALKNNRLTIHNEKWKPMNNIIQ